MMLTGKRGLRAACLQQRQLIAPDVLERRSAELAAMLVQHLANIKVSSIFLYTPFRSEPNLLPLLETMPMATFSLPVVAKVGEDMEFYRYELGDRLVANKWGIQEPIVDGDSIPSIPDATTAIIVPAVALDRSGYRLGYGAGFYDRYLVSCPNSMAIGVCFAEFLVDDVPNDYWDQALDYVCTDLEFFRSRQ